MKRGTHSCFFDDFNLQVSDCWEKEELQLCPNPRRLAPNTDYSATVQFDRIHEVNKLNKSHHYEYIENFTSKN